MAKKQLIENALAMSVAQLISLGLPLLALPYLAINLGPDQLGRVAFALSVAQIILILTDYGFNLSAPKSIAVHRDNPKKISEIWCEITLIKFALSLIGLLIIAVSTLFFEKAKNEFWLFIAAYSMVIGNVIFPQWLFQGLEQVKIISLIQVLSRLIVFVAIFILVKTKEDIYWATFLQSAGYLLGGILAFPCTMRALKGGQLKWPIISAIKLQLRDGWHIFLSMAANGVYSNGNVFFLSFFVTQNTLAQYHVAEKIIRAVQMMYVPISNSIYPHVSRLATSNPTSAIRFNQKLLVTLGGGATVISLLILIIGPYFIEIFFGKNYEEASIILQVFSGLPILIILSNILGMQTMLPFGMESNFSRILLIAAVFDMLIFIPAAYWFGAIGAAWANMAVELFIVVCTACILHSTNKNPLNLSFLLRKK